MNANLQKLEYDKILEKLSHYAVTYLGKNYCYNLLPSNDKKIVKDTLKETEEAVSILYKAGVPPIDEIADNTINIKTLESNMILSIKSILELSKILIISEELKKYFYNITGQTDFRNLNIASSKSNANISKSNFENLNDIFSRLYTNSAITNKISTSILDEDTIADNASKNLATIRRRLRSIETEIRDKLSNFIHSSTYSKYLQDNVITIRDDRFVIPVKSEYRSQIKGFVHDISSSGSTVFIEPMVVFDLNNEISNLKIEENIEISKILQNLCNLFVPYIKEIKTDIDIIGKLDFIFAKAKYSKEIYGITPEINDEKKVVLKNAKHPLLDQNKAVPFNLTLGEDFTTLVITGPNTGGKTVTLKTIGLLSAMACSGLDIPASEGSSIYVFDNIFADIGDEQSIDNSLSTFSSHIKNIVDIVNTSTSDSLVLVDELGSGTDPAQGAALAISILKYFKNKDSITVATTHYQELKKYAMITDGFENASVEFDISTLSPTYKLLVGVPGKSNAFEIGEKLGLSAEIINSAKSNLNKKDVDFEELLKSIYDDKSKIEAEKAQISDELEKVTSLRKSLERDNSDLFEQEAEIINNAKIEARDILLEAKEEASEIISKMRKASDDFNKNLKLQNLNVNYYNNSNMQNLELYRNQLNEAIKKINTETNKDIEVKNRINPEDICKGMDVYVTTLGQKGTVISNISKSNEVMVQIGNIKTSVNINVLSKIKGNNDIIKSNKNVSSVYSGNLNANKNKNSTTFVHLNKNKTVNSELNVIGLTVDEAVPIVDKFLDDCYLAKLDTVRIVHGKGTGKLRKGIQSFLKTNPYVKSFRIGTYGEGEMGVTVVELNKK